MDPKVLVVNAVKKETDGFGDILRPAGFTPWIIDNIEGVEPALSAGDSMAVLLDLDSLEVSNRTVRQMTLKFPKVCFLCTSWEPFHPELQDAICYHIYACVQKPIDPDELLYWLKCIHQDQAATPKDAGHPE
jgi:DNA-binding NtrC family response regulator